jgi:hypothetical protein
VVSSERWGTIVLGDGRSAREREQTRRRIEEEARIAAQLDIKQTPPPAQPQQQQQPQEQEGEEEGGEQEGQEDEG